MINPKPVCKIIFKPTREMNMVKGTILWLIISKFDGWALIGAWAAIRTNTVIAAIPILCSCFTEEYEKISINIDSSFIMAVYYIDFSQVSSHPQLPWCWSSFYFYFLFLVLSLACPGQSVVRMLPICWPKRLSESQVLPVSLPPAQWVEPRQALW